MPKVPCVADRGRTRTVPEPLRPLLSFLAVIFLELYPDHCRFPWSRDCGVIGMVIQWIQEHHCIILKKGSTFVRALCVVSEPDTLCVHVSKNALGSLIKLTQLDWDWPFSFDH